MRSLVGWSLAVSLTASAPLALPAAAADAASPKCPPTLGSATLRARPEPSPVSANLSKAAIAEGINNGDPWVIYAASATCAYSPPSDSWLMELIASNNKDVALSRIKQQYSDAKARPVALKAGVEQAGYLLSATATGVQSVAEVFVGPATGGKAFMVSVMYRHPAETAPVSAAVQAAFAAQR